MMNMGGFVIYRCLKRNRGHVIQMEDETWQKVQTMKKTWIFDLLITLITVTVLKTPFPDGAYMAYSRDDFDLDGCSIDRFGSYGRSERI